MKQRILLSLVMISFVTALHAQKKNQQESKTIGYAITAAEKGGRSWKEVRQVDVTTGQELKNIYSSTTTVDALNARTGKPVQKKEISPIRTTAIFKTVPDVETKTIPGVETKTVQTRKVVNLDDELNNEVKEKIRTELREQKLSYTVDGKDMIISGMDHNNVHVYYIGNGMEKIQADKPFATNSAAMAYDKKHERLYYTPMGINQLRYIDLKSNKIYYFEDEAFGKVNGMGDAPNQITRMVIASDGNGYALTNDGRNLIRFTTGKNPTITELGEVNDDAADAKVSVHSRNGYGGDMVADASGNLYLVTANRNVFKINIEKQSAQWLGAIKGLPQGFSTNGAMVEEGSKVIIASSESTVGYFRFDLTTLQAEKISGGSEVFNASDLANGNLAFDKKKKKKDRKNDDLKDENKTVETQVIAKTSPITETMDVKGITVYPNPVTNGIVKLAFEDQPAGKYQAQIFDLDGKLITSQEVSVQNKLQITEVRLPNMVSHGTYFVKVTNDASKVSSVTKLIVQ